ncbi:MAG TPA: hypothetical protein VIG57_16495 [Candidatus Entotheonella sp.]|jgi:hypothetical protein
MQRPNLAPLSCVNVECGRNEMDPCAVKTVPWNEGSIFISASRIESIAIWDREDEELLVVAKQHLETLRKRHSSVT